MRARVGSRSPGARPESLKVTTGSPGWPQLSRLRFRVSQLRSVSSGEGPGPCDTARARLTNPQVRGLEDYVLAPRPGAERAEDFPLATPALARHVRIFPHLTAHGAAHCLCPEP